MATRRENDTYVFQGGVRHTILPDVNHSECIDDTTIDAGNLEFIKLVNVAPVTVEDIKGGSPGRSVKFQGDGQTTFEDNAIIKTNTGVNKLLLADIIYTFTFYNDLWIENE